MQDKQTERPRQTAVGPDARQTDRQTDRQTGRQRYSRTRCKTNRQRQTTVGPDTRQTDRETKTDTVRQPEPAGGKLTDGQK